MNKKIPKGLIFSSGNQIRRRKSVILSLILIIIQIGFIWPVYPFFASPAPLIFGLPLSMFWVLALLITAALVVLIFFLNDTKQES